MSKMDPIQLILAVIDPEYASDIDINVIKRDKRLLKSALKTAERNGLDFHFMSRLKELNLTLPFEDEKRWQEETTEVKKSIILLNNISRDNGINYVWIKSCNPIPHIPRDIDILIHNEDKARLMIALEKEGLIKEQPSKVQILLEKKGLLRIDIYTDICYFSVKFLNEDFLWSSVVRDEVFEIEYPNLNNEANFLLCLVHSLFGHRSMSLLDFLHMKRLINTVDIDVCREKATQNRWGKVFDLYLNEFHDIYQRIYMKHESISFPFIYNTKFVLRCVTEINSLNLKGCTKMAFTISLGLDRLRASKKNTALYKMLRSFPPTRLLFNKIITIFRVMRGDRTV